MFRRVARLCYKFANFGVVTTTTFTAFALSPIKADTNISTQDNINIQNENNQNNQLSLNETNIKNEQEIQISNVSKPVKICAAQIKDF